MKYAGGDVAAWIEAREREVVGDGPRILPMPPSALDEDALVVSRRLTGAVGGTKQFDTVEDVTDFVPTMLHHPGVLKAIVETGLMLLGDGVLPPRHREMAILRVAWRSGAPYEWGEHIVIAKRCGIDAEEIERIVAGPDSGGWTGIEQSVLRAVDELLDAARIGDSTWAALAGAYTPAQLIELTMLVGQYQLVAYLQNSLRMRLSEDNGGLAAR